MSLAADRPEFAPPPQRGTPRALALALIAHALLIAALTWGVHWKREADDDAIEAELWSSTVQQAAPRPVPPPAPVPPPPPPAPTPAPQPPPPPPPPAVKPPEPAPRPPDIALEREKKLKEQKERERQEAAEDERQEKLKREQLAAKKAQEQKERDAKQRAEQEAQRKKDEQQQKLAEQKKREDAEAKKAEAAKQAAADAAKQAAAERAATLKRMQAMAGISGSDDQTSAPRKGKGSGAGSGPSASYNGKVQQAVRPNITYADADLVNGNPGVEIEVRTAPDGSIIGTPRILKSSGVPSWDEAAQRAIIKTDRMPRDIDGTVPTPMIVVLRPKG